MSRRFADSPFVVSLHGPPGQEAGRDDLLYLIRLGQETTVKKENVRGGIVGRDPKRGTLPSPTTPHRSG